MDELKYPKGERVWVGYLRLIVFAIRQTEAMMDAIPAAPVMMSRIEGVGS